MKTGFNKEVKKEEDKQKLKGKEDKLKREGELIKNKYVLLKQFKNKIEQLNNRNNNEYK